MKPGEKEITNPCRLDDPNLNPCVVIMADRVPTGGKVTGLEPGSGVVTPSNHSRDLDGGSGESLLRADSSVSYYGNQPNSKGGYLNDDIYVNNAGVLGGEPCNTMKDGKSADDGSYDTVITPYPSRDKAAAAQSQPSSATSQRR